eukprot:GDKJ01032730.1.p1 GENE.GDKJ01032730.1~~GDKJ01032730.1.p1  ORF type:complete len:2278 (+),score=711.29 GDKJ01032730.1:376-6834(+)
MTNSDSGVLSGQWLSDSQKNLGSSTNYFETFPSTTRIPLTPLPFSTVSSRNVMTSAVDPSNHQILTTVASTGLLTQRGSNISHLQNINTSPPHMMIISADAQFVNNTSSTTPAIVTPHTNSNSNKNTCVTNANLIHSNSLLNTGSVPGLLLNLNSRLNCSSMEIANNKNISPSCTEQQHKNIISGSILTENFIRRSIINNEGIHSTSDVSFVDADSHHIGEINTTESQKANSLSQKNMNTNHLFNINDSQQHQNSFVSSTLANNNNNNVNHIAAAVGHQQKQQTNSNKNYYNNNNKHASQNQQQYFLYMNQNNNNSLMINLKQQDLSINLLNLNSNNNNIPHANTCHQKNNSPPHSKAARYPASPPFNPSGEKPVCCVHHAANHALLAMGGEYPIADSVSMTSSVASGFASSTAFRRGYIHLQTSSSHPLQPKECLPTAAENEEEDCVSRRETLSCRDEKINQLNSHESSIALPEKKEPKTDDDLLPVDDGDTRSANGLETPLMLKSELTTIQCVEECQEHAKLTTISQLRDRDCSSPHKAKIEDYNTGASPRSSSSKIVRSSLIKSRPLAANLSEDNAFCPVDSTNVNGLHQNAAVLQKEEQTADFDSLSKAGDVAVPAPMADRAGDDVSNANCRVSVSSLSESIGVTALKFPHHNLPTCSQKNIPIDRHVCEPYASCDYDTFSSVRGDTNAHGNQSVTGGKKSSSRSSRRTRSKKSKMVQQIMSSASMPTVASTAPVVVSTACSSHVVLNRENTISNNEAAPPSPPPLVTPANSSEICTNVVTCHESLTTLRHHPQPRNSPAVPFAPPPPPPSRQVTANLPSPQRPPLLVTPPPPQKTPSQLETFLMRRTPPPSPLQPSTSSHVSLSSSNFDFHMPSVPIPCSGSSSSSFLQNQQNHDAIFQNHQHLITSASVSSSSSFLPSHRLQPSTSSAAAGMMMHPHTSSFRLSSTNNHQQQHVNISHNLTSNNSHQHNRNFFSSLSSSPPLIDHQLLNSSSAQGDSVPSFMDYPYNTNNNNNNNAHNNLGGRSSFPSVSSFSSIFYPATINPADEDLLTRSALTRSQAAADRHHHSDRHVSGLHSQTPQMPTTMMPSASFHIQQQQQYRHHVNDALVIMNDLNDALDRCFSTTNNNNNNQNNFQQNNHQNNNVNVGNAPVNTSSSSCWNTPPPLQVDLSLPSSPTPLAANNLVVANHPANNANVVFQQPSLMNYGSSSNQLHSAGAMGNNNQMASNFRHHQAHSLPNGVFNHINTNGSANFMNMMENSNPATPCRFSAVSANDFSCLFPLSVDDDTPPSPSCLPASQQQPFNPPSPPPAASVTAPTSTLRSLRMKLTEPLSQKSQQALTAIISVAANAVNSSPLALQLLERHQHVLPERWKEVVHSTMFNNSSNKGNANNNNNSQSSQSGLQKSPSTSLLNKNKTPNPLLSANNENKNFHHAPYHVQPPASPSVNGGHPLEQQQAETYFPSGAWSEPHWQNFHGANNSRSHSLTYSSHSFAPQPCFMQASPSPFGNAPSQPHHPNIHVSTSHHAHDAYDHYYFPPSNTSKQHSAHTLSQDPPLHDESLTANSNGNMMLNESGNNEGVNGAAHRSMLPHSHSLPFMSSNQNLMHDDCASLSHFHTQPFSSSTPPSSQTIEAPSSTLLNFNTSTNKNDNENNNNMNPSSNILKDDIQFSQQHLNMTFQPRVARPQDLFFQAASLSSLMHAFTVSLQSLPNQPPSSAYPVITARSYSRIALLDALHAVSHALSSLAPQFDPASNASLQDPLIFTQLVWNLQDGSAEQRERSTSPFVLAALPEEKRSAVLRFDSAVNADQPVTFSAEAVVVVDFSPSLLQLSASCCHKSHSVNLALAEEIATRSAVKLLYGFDASGEETPPSALAGKVSADQLLASSVSNVKENGKGKKKNISAFSALTNNNLANSSSVSSANFGANSKSCSISCEPPVSRLLSHLLKLDKHALFLLSPEGIFPLPSSSPLCALQTSKSAPPSPAVSIPLPSLLSANSSSKTNSHSGSHLSSSSSSTQNGSSVTSPSVCVCRVSPNERRLLICSTGGEPHGRQLPSSLYDAMVPIASGMVASEDVACILLVMSAAAGRSKQFTKWVRSGEDQVKKLVSDMHTIYKVDVPVLLMVADCMTTPTALQIQSNNQTPTTLDTN